MNKISKILLVATLLFLFNACPLQAVENESTMNIDTTAKRDVAPDTVRIRFYVENSGLNVSDIKSKNDKIVNDVIAKIKAKLGKNEEVKTIAFSVNNVYSYKDKVRVFQKYEVRNGFEVKLKDLAKISEIIKIATDNGVKRVENLNFSIENGNQVCNELMAEAIGVNKTRANYLVNAAGTSILKIKSINPYCSLNSTYQPRYYANTMKAEAAMADGASTLDVIEPGTINVNSTVNMVYYLK